MRSTTSRSQCSALARSEALDARRGPLGRETPLAQVAEHGLGGDVVVLDEQELGH